MQYTHFLAHSPVQFAVQMEIDDVLTNESADAIMQIRLGLSVI